MEDEFIFITSDCQNVKAPYQLSNMCTFLKTNNQQNNNEINIKYIANSETLYILLLYCKKHKYVNPEPIKVPITTRFIEVKYDGDELILELSLDKTIDLLTLATKLECAALEDLCYAHMATTIRSIIKN